MIVTNILLVTYKDEINTIAFIQELWASLTKRQIEYLVKNNLITTIK